MSTILNFANKLAIASKYPGTVKPVTKWKRAMTIEKVSGWELQRIGLLTSSESCVIQALRQLVAQVSKAQQTAMMLVFLDIANTLEITENRTAKGIADLLKDGDKFSKLCEEKNVTIEKAQEWNASFAKIKDQYNVQSTVDMVKTHIVTFMMAMRCDGDWDYDDTEQLSVDEFNEIYEFILKEEDQIPVEDDTDTLPLKKQ